MGSEDFLALVVTPGEPFHKDWIICSRFGHVVGRKGEVKTDIAERLAASCPSFGEDAPSVIDVANLKLGVYTPDTDLLEVTDPTDRPASCYNCQKYDGSFNACAATGQIVFQGDSFRKANDCSFGLDGAPMSSVQDVLPGWDGPQVVFTTPVSVAPTKAPAKPTPALLAVIEPVDYTSDATVTQEHADKGVLAWRAVTTPRGRVHHLPIFRTDFVPEEHRHLIPSSSSEHGDPSLYVDHNGLLAEFAVQVYQKDLNLCLNGEPGAGKTEGVRYIAWQMNLPFRRLTYNEGSEMEQYLGLYQYGPYNKVDPDTGEVTEVIGTHLVPGLLPQAWVEMGITLSDEPNLAPEAIFQSYRSLNDSSRTLQVYNETFRRHDYQFHVMAINPHWDFRNIGAKPLAAADSRRLAFFWMADPSDDMKRSILTSSLAKLDGTVLDRAVLKAIMEAGKDLRQMAKDQLLPDFWTLSQEIKVARLVDDFGLEGAYRRAYFNYVDPQTTEQAMTAIRSHIPYGVDWS